MAKIKLTIEGMHCDGCSKTISGYLLMKDGVSSAKIDFPSHKGEVEFDENKVKEEEILKMIEEVGYRAAKI